MADTQDRSESADRLIELHITTATSTTPSTPVPSLVSPRLAPYIEVQHEISDPSVSATGEPHPRTGSPENETQTLLHDLTQHEYDEMSKIETEMRQQAETETPHSHSRPDPVAHVEDEITIDDYGMVRVQGQELMKLEESIAAAASSTTDEKASSENGCEEEAQIIDVMIERIEKGAGQSLKGEDDELTIIEEHLHEPGSIDPEEEEEIETDEDAEGDDDDGMDDSVPSEGKGGGRGSAAEGEHVVIYLNSATKSKRQIQVNKCERCNLLFGSRSLLYSHYSSVHLSARTTSATNSSPSSAKGGKGPQSQYRAEDQDFILDPGAMVVDVGPRQFQCRKCGREFKRSFDVIRHFDCVHNAPTAGGLRAYACHYCDKAFARKDNLQRHERTHDSNRTLFSCETCHKLFTRRCDTIRHFQVVHQKQTKIQSS